MDTYKNLELLGRAFANGEIDAFAEAMNENCKYNSDYAHRRLTSAEQILDNMRKVNAYVDRETASGNDCTYSYEIVRLEELLRPEITLRKLKGDSFFDVYEYGMLLYQYGDENPVAIVYIKSNPGGQITEINLSRNRQWFDMLFFEDDPTEDSEKDIPYTVMPISSHDQKVRELQDAFTYQKQDYTELEDSEVYIWRQSDKFFKKWLKDNGYYMQESQVFDDCIGYRCNRKGYAYTIYMFAFGQRRTTQLDGEYCQKLLQNKLSEKSFVLIAYLNVKRIKENGKTKYHVGNYSGEESRPIDLWRVTSAEGKPILDYFPSLEMMEMTYKLMYAFNHDDQDVYDCIIADHNPAFNGLDYEGTFYNVAFFNNLYRLHKEYGEMKIGYVRYNDVIYSETPYIEGYGFFGFRVDNSTGRIQEIIAYPFEDDEKQYAEFIKTEAREGDDWYGDKPEAVEVRTLEPVHTERFAAAITFDNGECRKYVLPIDLKDEKDEIVSFNNYVFTDKIWQSASLVPGEGYHLRKALNFANGYTVSTLKCYEEGEAYSEPEQTGNIIYQDEEFKVQSCWKWNVKSMYMETKAGIMKTLISGSAFNYYGVSTYASVQGKRLCSISFDYISDFDEGIAVVGKAGHGYGYINEKMEFITPMTYEDANSFANGKARACRDGIWFYIDREGNETELKEKERQYQDEGNLSEGMRRVSTLKLGFMDLAYHSDYSEIAGIWGFVNENGEEIVRPQYIYAQDFDRGIAIVCKGEWTRDKKWEEGGHKGKYWTEEELWGAIDKDGNEVIPFIFDEIKDFWTEEPVYMAHYGGWREGKWGVIDNHGNWLVEPIFEDLDYEYHDGLFIFYDDDRFCDVPAGIYDLNEQKVLFKPQFEDVSFEDDGWIRVEMQDENLGRRIQKLIDRDGNEKFHSEYSTILPWKKPYYEVRINDKKGTKTGLIDEDGTVILPCEYEIPYYGINQEKKLITFVEDGKQGLKDFEGRVLIDPKYDEIHVLDKPLITVYAGKGENRKEGLIDYCGNVVIPTKYRNIQWMSEEHFLCSGIDGCELFWFDKSN